MGNIVAFVDDSNKLTIADFESGRKIEVSQDHHGLSKIDQVKVNDFQKNTNACFQQPQVNQQAHQEEKGQDCQWKQIHLVNFEEGLLICSNFSIDSVPMDWHITRVMKVKPSIPVPIIGVDLDQILGESTLDAPLILTSDRIFMASNSHTHNNAYHPAYHQNMSTSRFQ